MTAQELKEGKAFEEIMKGKDKKTKGVYDVFDNNLNSLKGREARLPDYVKARNKLKNNLRILEYLNSKDIFISGGNNSSDYSSALLTEERDKEWMVSENDLLLQNTLDKEKNVEQKTWEDLLNNLNESETIIRVGSEQDESLELKIFDLFPTISEKENNNFVENNTVKNINSQQEIIFTQSVREEIETGNVKSYITPKKDASEFNTQQKFENLNNTVSKLNVQDEQALLPMENGNPFEIVPIERSNNFENLNIRRAFGPKEITRQNILNYREERELESRKQKIKQKNDLRRGLSP